MRVLLLVSYLGVGGAERQVLALAAQLRRRGHDARVATFYRGGAFEAQLSNDCVPLIHLGKRGAWDVRASLRGLLRIVDSFQPDILHGYLSVPNIYCAWVKQRRPGQRIVWGIRGTDQDLSHYGLTSRIAYWMENRLAHIPDIVIANAAAGERFALARGFPASRLRVVHNGIATGKFTRRPEGRARVRAEWDVKSDDFLIGIVSRLDPMKDHPTFLAAAELLAGGADARFVIVGGGPEHYLRHLTRSAGTRSRPLIRWAGPRADMADVYSALDVLTLCSAFGEGFPNVIGEAMACETPCVVTDVGDSAFVVGKTGRVVPARSPEALAKAWRDLLAMPSSERMSLGAAARDRVTREFSLDALADKTLAVLQNPLPLEAE